VRPLFFRGLVVGEHGEIPMLTVANQLTLLRMGLVPVLVVLVLNREYGWALGVFIAAGLTDLLDGFFARRGQSTKLGAMLDPVADKLLLGASYVVLTWASGLVCPLPVWLTVLILSRDAIIIVSVVVVNLALERRVFYPSLLGKLSTGAQIVTAGLVLLMNALDACPEAMHYVFVLTALLTVGSALHYVWATSGRRAPSP
jgi:cardiolipin synthase (CMP-forming)